MDTTDVPIEILRGIREEARATNARIDQTNERLDQTTAMLAERLERLERRQVESEVRLATEIVAVAGAVDRATDMIANLREDLKQDRALRARVDDHEDRIRAIESRV
jgi:hypothetical protein